MKMSYLILKPTKLMFSDLLYLDVMSTCKRIRGVDDIIDSLPSLGDYKNIKDAEAETIMLVQETNSYPLLLSFTKNPELCNRYLKKYLIDDNYLGGNLETIEELEFETIEEALLYFELKYKEGGS